MESKVDIWNIYGNYIRRNRVVRLWILISVLSGLIILLRFDFNQSVVYHLNNPDRLTLERDGKIPEISATHISAVSVRPIFPGLKLIKVPDTEKNNQRFKVFAQPLIHQTVNMLDKYMDLQSINYQAMRSMFLLWNPGASKWAARVSGKYHDMIDKRMSPPSDWYDDPDCEKVVERKVEVEPCRCERKIFELKTNPNKEEGNWSVSACSKHSFARGMKQKIISFTFYGDSNSKLSESRKYFEGILDNLKLVPRLYPGWIIRLYYDLTDDHPLSKKLCKVACQDSNLDLCHVRRIPSLGDISKVFPMNWRFMPLLDPQVSHVVSRDLDSLINSREVAAVQEWLKSDKAFHFMRDHPAHSIEILGSGWGARLGEQERIIINEAFSLAVKDFLFWAPRHAYGPDQGFLKRYIWPWAKWSALSHDAYSCLQFPRTSPFPTRRENGTNNFVAAVMTANDILLVKCPKKCRPESHLDWELC